MADECGARSVASSLTSKLLADPGVLAAFTHELNSMVGRSSGYIESLPTSVKRRIRALKKLQAELLKLESSFYAEVHELECKYAILYGPLHEKRQQIINAIIEPTDTDCEWESDVEDSKESETDETHSFGGMVESGRSHSNDGSNVDCVDIDVDGEQTKGIPEFWLTALKNVSEFSDLIKDHDEDVLKSLLDIRVKRWSEPNRGFQIEFVFSPNEYFSNEILTKKYILRYLPNPEKPLAYEGPEIMQCEGCIIDWKPGKNVTEKKIKEKRKDHTGGRKFVTKVTKVDSFFKFFSPPAGSKDEVEDEEVFSQLMADFELGHTLQERIIPRAVMYFTGDAVENTSESEGDTESEADGDNDKGDEDDDEEHDPDYVPPKNMKDGPPECRQQ